MSIDRWKDKENVASTYTVEYYSALLHKKETLPFVTTWISLVLNEISWTEKYKHCMTSLICGSPKSKIQNTKPNTQIQRIDWRLSEAGAEGWGKMSERERESESEAAQSCPSLCNPLNCSLSSASVHGIFQARVLEWVAISFSTGSSPPRDRTQVSHIGGTHFTVWATREVLGK